jgi:signal peptidase
MTGSATVTGPHAAAHAVRPRRRAAGSGALEIIRAVLLNIAAVGGAICIALVVLAVVLHITLIMFRTGSMAPAIPAGSLAVVKQIPAAEAHRGEVVTVDRPGDLPVTHRVVATAPGPSGSTQLTLKGDANPAPDPTPYDVTSVRRVVWSAPGLARFIVWLSNPLVIGGLTIAVAALVTWTLWPKRQESAEESTP